MTVTVRYGEWVSPVTAVMATEGMSAGQIAAPAYVGTVGAEVWWTEPRPTEEGRMALVRRRADGSTETVLPTPWNVRSRVIEYGGRPWDAHTGADGVLLVFVNFADQRLYAYDADVPGAGPRPLTPVSTVGGGLRWAEPEIDVDRGEVRCVLEEFTGEGPSDVRRVIVAVPLDGSAQRDRSAVRELCDDGHRFVGGPRFSPDGSRAVWLAWDHPYMPWDAAVLRIAEVDVQGRLHRVRTLTGGPGDPIAQAEWAADGSLLVAAERTGWWNLYRVDPETGQAVALHPAEQEFAGAQRLGLRWFAPLPDGRVAVLRGLGAQRLALLDPVTGVVTEVPGERSEWLPQLAVSGDRVVGVAGGPAQPYEIVEYDLPTGDLRVVRAGQHAPVDRGYLPEPLARVFTGPDGERIHALLYPPRNVDHAGSGAGESDPPPYVVWVHGGPTMRAPVALNLEIAYFTSRGIGVVQVDHGGSTGYGRAYRERLRDQWGVVDVGDCAIVARAIVDEGLTAPGRVAIRGISAGGFTAAASLVATDAYACATLLCPILDLYGLASGQTHDFESHYLESLVGPLATVAQRYRDRSPAAHPERIDVPFLLLQGLDDPICSPEQSERFLSGMSGHPVPRAHLTFAGEGHGFRRQDTMVACLEAELSLYGQVFGFTPPGVPVLALRS
ncbi:dipeptidyl aminopeptidase/acylaminoacyl peptidase [Micromonospora pisi]|uniref:Dipeptidyl aminopeptidase/acylaminoacyl peptidase n=1 Tax=Micromonospora pisi TaxID=589240 RepID=A0A495JH58_9ACTN|nr:prolyl oligopeptidase family serine peptidase [Micromonospora pisi]RKR88227.1 dipeptidyl aminopeptidase/acylaminoacyl peptidase [Micromonospora pisi]